MKKYTSWNEYIEVELKDGSLFPKVILDVSREREDEHILTTEKGETLAVKTMDLRRFKRNNGNELILQ